MSEYRLYILYTVIYDAYDDLRNRPQQSIDCDFVRFNDQPLFDSKRWQIIVNKKGKSHHPRMRAKFFRLMPHKIFRHLKFLYMPSNIGQNVLSGNEQINWMEGSVELRSADVAEELMNALGRHSMGMIEHPDKNCIYNEANRCHDFIRSRPLQLKKQVPHYRSEGYAEHNGLKAAGIIERKMSK